MPPLITDRAVIRLVKALRGTFANDVRQQRLDAGLSIRALSHAAGVDPSYLARIELGLAEPSLDTMARISLALGSDLVARIYPNTGPLVRDRHQAPIGEALVAGLHSSWSRFAEVAVRRPARGWIDWAFHGAAQRVVVAAEVQSSLPRVEQLLRWSEEKAASLPSSDIWTRLQPEPEVTRLLVVRGTRATRTVATEFRRSLRAAFPGDPEDALASLTSGLAWPGAAMLWAVRREGDTTYRIVARP